MKVRLASVFVAAVAVLACACTKPAPQKQKEFETVFTGGSAVYTETVNGVAQFKISLNSNSKEFEYGTVKMNLYTKDVDPLDFKLDDGDYVLSSEINIGTAGDMIVLTSALGMKVNVVDASVNVQSGKISGRISLENGDVLNFHSQEALRLSSSKPFEGFKVEVLDNSFYQLKISITPVNPAQSYFYTVMPVSRFAGKSDSQILSEIHNFYAALIQMGMVENGPIVVTNEETGKLDPLTEYAVYVYGVENATPATGLFTYKFTTSDQNNPSDVTFSSTISDITKNGALAKVEPSDNTVLYVWDLVLKNTFDSYGKVEGEFLSKWLTNQIDGSLWKDIKDVVAGCGARGPQEYTYETLSSNSEYVLFAVCVDRDGNAVSKAYVSEPFKTLESKVSDVFVYQEERGYYDGDALAAADPAKYGSYAGKYYVKLELVVESGTPVNTYAAIVEKDPSSYSDEQLISALMKSGQKNKTELWYLVNKSATATTTFWALTVADDANGDFGVVDRYQMYLFQSGCKPISDIIK